MLYLFASAAALPGAWCGGALKPGDSFFVLLRAHEVALVDLSALLPLSM